ncbi:MAG: rRNA maturation RNase YbeY [Nonlabens sp.]|nr:rRNA maturation RNase YbeY [Nonlabens sp.]
MIDFNYQNDFEPIDEVVYSRWLERVATSESNTIGEISYVFCSDEYLLELNKQFLNHDTYTDIVTFDYCENGLINGELYISTDRVADNAVDFGVTFSEELHRVMAHGLLHLMGYGDKSENDIVVMRSKEMEKMNMFHVKQ